MTLPAMLIATVGGLLLVASWEDLTTYRIANWIPLVIFAMFPAYALGIGLTLDQILWHAVAFTVTLAIGFALFAWGKVGGGDVKLLAALALWAGWGMPLVNLLAVTTILGGVLSLAILLCRATPVAFVVDAFFRARGWSCAVFDPGNKDAPYGVAISAAFFVLLFAPLTWGVS